MDSTACGGRVIYGLGHRVRDGHVVPEKLKKDVPVNTLRTMGAGSSMVEVNGIEPSITDITAPVAPNAGGTGPVGLTGFGVPLPLVGDHPRRPTAWW